MAKSTLSTVAGKGTVGESRPDFPLTPRPTGRWCKKVKGKLHYFGHIEKDAKGEARP